MTTTSAKIIADSVSPQGIRLTTMQLRYPRCIHSESKTHRVISENEIEMVTPGVMNDPNLSRNARSSRAVPVARMIEEVLTDPYMPRYWGANQKGMQAGVECDNKVEIALDLNHSVTLTNKEAWLFARDRAVEVARGFADAHYHKQVVNRLLEPYMHIDTVVTATEWENFFALRIHPAAEPHIRDLAIAMREAMDASTPVELEFGDWHLPYISVDDLPAIRQWIEDHPTIRTDPNDIARKMSVVRCAQVSYTPFLEAKLTIDQEIERHDQLVGARPMHASPCEHQATPDSKHFFREAERWVHLHLHGNLVGWRQYRKMLPGESVAG